MWDGFVTTTGGKEYRCRILLPEKSAGLSGARLECEPQLARLLQGREAVLESRLRQSRLVPQLTPKVEG